MIAYQSCQVSIDTLKKSSDYKDTQDGREITSTYGVPSFFFCPCRLHFSPVWVTCTSQGQS